MKPLVLPLLLISSLAFGEPLTVKLWPGGASEPAAFKPSPETDKKSGDGIRRVSHVADPTITIYQPSAATGTAVLVCPGGGYNILAIEHEGTQVCERLNAIGVTAILLKYRVPKRNEADPSKEPLQDAQRAMGLIRHNAAKWGLKPDRIGILGF